MNEQFYELPQEKQLRIINAGLEVFSKNDYKEWGIYIILILSLLKLHLS